jgi:hypothetical protein
MSTIATPPIGFASARRVVEAGRGSFFSSPEEDLPANRSPEVAANDVVPQFGFVGAQFRQHGVLLLGINPGNGPDKNITPADAKMMPALKAFAASPTDRAFSVAQSAYLQVCESWPVWDRHCLAILVALGLSANDIAYSNALPWRTASKSAFGPFTSERAATLYAGPLVQELSPRVVVAVGKKAEAILHLARVELPRVIVWNRAQALTQTVAAARAAAVAELRAICSS